jgi:hypothetical protein
MPPLDPRDPRLSGASALVPAPQGPVTVPRTNQLSSAANLVAPMAAGQPAAQPGQPKPRRRYSGEEIQGASRDYLRNYFGQQGMQLDDDKLNRLNDVFWSVRRGQTAKQMDKSRKSALARYFSAVVQKDNAENAFTQTSERMQSRIASALAEKDTEKQAQYEDSLAASRTHMDAARKRAAGMADILEKKYQIPRKYLENPVSVFEFINQSAGQGADDDILDDLYDEQGNELSQQPTP